MEDILKRSYTNLQGKTTTLGELLNKDDYFEKTTTDGLVFERGLKKSGALKIAHFLSVSFSEPRILQSPADWNNFNYALMVEASFPTTNEVYADLGESDDASVTPHKITFKLTFAYERAKKRAILNSATVGLSDLLSDKEKIALEERVNAAKFISEVNNSSNKLDDVPANENFIALSELDLGSFILPKSDRYGGLTLFEVLKIDFEHLRILRNNYPHNMKLQKAISALSERYKHSMEAVEQFEKEFKSEFEKASIPLALTEDSDSDNSTSISEELVDTPKELTEPALSSQEDDVYFNLEEIEKEILNSNETVSEASELKSSEQEPTTTESDSTITDSLSDLEQSNNVPSSGEFSRELDFLNLP